MNLKLRLWMLSMIVVLVAGSPVLLPGAAAAGNRGAAQQPPVAGTLPVDGATGVRPDTPISFRFDTVTRKWTRFRQGLAQGGLLVSIESATGEAVTFAGRDGPVEFDSQTGVLTIRDHPPLRPYTRYTVSLKVKAAAIVTPVQPGRIPADLPPGPFPPVSFSFVTGSALHQATKIHGPPGEPAAATAGEDVEVRFLVTDDYGLPAEGAVLTLELEESGDRPDSAQASLSTTYLAPGAGGEILARVRDTEAESVTATLKVTDLETSSSVHASQGVVFVSGPPARAWLSAAAREATAGESIPVTGRVEDRFGNGVGSLPVVFHLEESRGRRRQHVAETDPSGAVETEVGSDTGQMVAVDLVAGGNDPGAGAVRGGLGAPLLFTEEVLSGTLVARRLGLRVPGPEEAGALPIEAEPPQTVRGQSGSLPPGKYLRLLSGQGELGNGQVAGDGSFTITAQQGFSAGDLLFLDLADQPFLPQPVRLSFSGDLYHRTFKVFLPQGRARLRYCAYDLAEVFYTTSPVIYRSWDGMSDTEITGGTLVGAGPPSAAGRYGGVTEAIVDLPVTGEYAFNMNLGYRGPRWYLTVEVPVP